MRRARSPAPRWRPIALATCVLAGLVAASCVKPTQLHSPTPPRAPEGDLRIIAFDVGQADATLIVYKGRSLLIDCGASLKESSRAAEVIPKRLDALLGSRHLDYFLVTHYHQDHLGSFGHRRGQREASGMFALIAEAGVTIGTLLDRGFVDVALPGPTERSYERAVDEWTAAGAVSSRRELHAGDTIDMGPGLEIKVVVASANGFLERFQALHPAFVEGSPPSENDNSIGVKVTLGDFEMFLAGDLSGANVVRHFGATSQSYNDIESRIAQDVGAVEVYRVDHHGSANSSNACFTQVLHPLVSVLSTGDNGYGHPALSVYRRLKSFGALYITGGAASQVRGEVADDIVGGDVEIRVDSVGRWFWVNGTTFQALSDAEEASRPDARAGCNPPDVADIKLTDFHEADDAGD